MQATIPGGVVGNYQDFYNGDAQPAIPLGGNPITTTAGQNSITVAMTNANVQLSTVSQSFVCLSGATPVGGITPSGTCGVNGTGWLPVQSVSANSFTVNWPTPATTSATGGGTAVKVQPSFAVITNKQYVSLTSGGNGFRSRTTISPTAIRCSISWSPRSWAVRRATPNG